MALIIRCIDLETTGIPTPEDAHAVVECGICDVGSDGSPITEPVATLFDPQRPIPPEAMAVHHITNDMVRGLGAFIFPSAAGISYLAAHVADFERQFLPADAPPLICTYKVALRLWPEAPSHGLQYLRYYLGLEVDPALAEKPHRAGPDAYVCAVLMARILATDSHPSFEDMVRWSNGPALLPRINFGKHKGSKWEDVPLDYLDWIVAKSDLDRDIKANARHHLKLRSQQQ